MKYLLSLFLLAVFYSLSAQQVERKTLTYEDTLGMDVFIPQDGKAARPLLIYVHGGGFSGGERDLPNHLEFCERYAERGWVTATISYHLMMKGQSFGCDQPVQNKINTFYVSARNIHQAVAYLLSKKDELAIDPSRVVIAGSSAGAEAVLHAAYWKKTRDGMLPNDFKYAGVISMAGALLDQRWITAQTAIPTALFHGTCDNLVPYANAPHHYCAADQTGFMMLYGSYAVAMRLKELNQPYFLMTDCGGGHEWNEYPIREKYDDMIRSFLEQDILNQDFRQVHQVRKEGNRDCDTGPGLCK